MNYKILKSILLFLLVYLLSACSEYEVIDPVMTSLKITSYETGVEIDPLNVPVGKQMKYYIDTNADLCVIWPAGKRNVLKSKTDSSKDSVNVYGDVVLAGNAASDDYRDYGLFGAKGVTSSGSPYSGYSTTYTYSNAGTYKMVIVVTKHGVKESDFSQQVFEKTIVVK